MRISTALQRLAIVVGMLLLNQLHGASQTASESPEIEPWRAREMWQHGIYDNPVRAAELITPDFLRNLEVNDPYFVDAVRMFYATDQARSMSSDPKYVGPVGTVIMDEILRRGDEVVPVLIALMDQPPDPSCALKLQILSHTSNFHSIDMEPFLNYVRKYLKEHPDEKETYENSGDYAGMNWCVSAFGDAEDIALLRNRDGWSEPLKNMENRLAKEKITGVTRLEERRQIRASLSLEAPHSPSALSSNKPTVAPSESPPSVSTATYWLVIVLAFVVVVVATAVRVGR